MRRGPPAALALTPSADRLSSGAKWPKHQTTAKAAPAAKARARKEERRRQGDAAPTDGPKCSVEKCKQPVRAKGYCRKHFIGWRRGELGKQAPLQDLLEGSVPQAARARRPLRRAQRARARRPRAPPPSAAPGARPTRAEDRHPRRRSAARRSPRLGRQERGAADPRLVAAGAAADRSTATSPRWATCAPWAACSAKLGAEVDQTSRRAPAGRHRATSTSSRRPTSW